MGLVVLCGSPSVLMGLGLFFVPPLLSFIGLIPRFGLTETF